MPEDIQKKIFSTNLKSLLTERSKNQLEVAKSIGVSPQTFNTWTQGIAIPRMGKLQKLADYFGVNKSDLLEEHSASEEDDYYINEEARRLADAMHKDPRYQVLFDASRKVKPEDIEKVKQMIDLMRSDYDGDNPA